MRLKQIAVRKLFNLFDHTIAVKPDEHITIILGPNGFGKTVMLQMIAGLFSARYTVFKTYPFADFTLTFEDASFISIRKESAQQGDLLGRPANENATQFLTIIHQPADGKTEMHRLDLERDAPSSQSSYLERFLPYLTRIGTNRWVHDDTHEVFTLVEAVDRFADELPPAFLEQMVSNQEPEWLRSLRSRMEVRFIQSQRLIEQSNRPNRPGAATAAIVRYSKTVSDLIKSTLAKYAEVSQRKDRTFPQRLLASTPLSMNREQLHETLVALEDKRQSLVKAGLLDVSPEGEFGASLPINDDQLNVLTIYVNDVEEKLHVFDRTAAQIELFKNIIGKLFKYKELVIDRSTGFSFTTSNRRPLPLTSLSSGEQHEVVLLASLLLNDRPASLFLIDEPELSLHVHWQKQFLRDLAAITSLLDIDVIIATHSPQIINDRWDLTVQLEGPEQEITDGD